MIAALFVQTDGCYFDIEGVDPWDEKRDARLYNEMHRVIAHPPCQAWGRYASSHPIKGSNYRASGQDDGCFASALANVHRVSGVIEHPAHSKAWAHFGLPIPKHGGGWTQPDIHGGRSCYVEQAHYGHFSRKPTWLYFVGSCPPDLIWGCAEQRLPAYAVERYGYEKARRIGVMAAVGGKNKTRIREATPAGFRDLLINLVSD